MIKAIPVAQLMKGDVLLYRSYGLISDAIRFIDRCRGEPRGPLSRPIRGAGTHRRRSDPGRRHPSGAAEEHRARRVGRVPAAQGGAVKYRSRPGTRGVLFEERRAVRLRADPSPGLFVYRPEPCRFVRSRKAHPGDARRRRDLSSASLQHGTGAHDLLRVRRPVLP